MIEYFVPAILVATLFGSNIFWATVCLKLTNRIMSRDYHDLKQAEKKPAKIVLAPEDTSDPVAERHAQDMNSLIGIA